MDFGILIPVGVIVLSCGMALLPIHTESKKGMALIAEGYNSRTIPRVILIVGSSLASYYLMSGIAHAISVSSFRHRQNRWHSWACLLFCWRCIGRPFPCLGEKGLSRNQD